jgi:hypothetical protein
VGATIGDLNGQGPVSCGVTTALRLYCWDDALVPTTRCRGGRRYRAVSVGYEHICAVNQYDVGLLLGRRSVSVSSALARETAAPHADSRARRDTDGASYSPGASHTCGATQDNKGYCWGWNNFNQLGKGIVGAQASRADAIAGG